MRTDVARKKKTENRDFEETVDKYIDDNRQT